MADYKDAPYFFINTKTGKQYLGKIEAAVNNITLSEDKAGKLVVESFEPTNLNKFIKVSEVFELILMQTQQGPQPVPVQYSQTATGSSSLNIQAAEIGTINCLDEGTEAVKAIKAIASGIIPANAADIEKSSKIIHKYSGKGRS